MENTLQVAFQCKFLEKMITSDQENMEEIDCSREGCYQKY